jgi:two-component system, NtrC family, sensor kinase
MLTPYAEPLVPLHQLREAEQRLHASNQLLQALTQVQLESARGTALRPLFQRLLSVLLELTGSEYGFIGEVLQDEGGRPYLKTHAITNIAWTDELRDHYARCEPQGLEFRNLDTLFGSVLTTGQPLLTNEPHAHPRRGGTPQGHPTLRCFLGLPFKVGEELLGMVGIANHPGGYQPELMDFLQPFLVTCSSLIQMQRSERLRRQAEEQLHHKQQQLLRAEEELRRHQVHLEELVQSRTEKLQQATRSLEEHQLQLVQAEKMASLGLMVAGIAHEINNPVAYVISNLSTLGRYLSVLQQCLGLYRDLEQVLPGGLPPLATALREQLRALREGEDLDYLLRDTPEVLSDTLEGATRVKQLIDELRIFSRQESGEPQPVDVTACLESTLRFVWGVLQQRCEVRCYLRPLPRVLGHASQLSQVFTNLLLNAAQAMEQRGEVRISARQEGAEVVVRIADTGCGMGPETLSKLFTPFFTTKSPGHGTGLGLPICYSIVSRHRGRIEVQSQPGQGSTFTVRLPALTGSEGEAR